MEIIKMLIRTGWMHFLSPNQKCQGDLLMPQGCSVRHAQR